MGSARQKEEAEEGAGGVGRRGKPSQGAQIEARHLLAYEVPHPGNHIGAMAAGKVVILIV